MRNLPKLSVKFSKQCGGGVVKGYIRQQQLFAQPHTFCGFRFVGHVLGYSSCSVRIHDILVRIRISGSVPMTNGSGSRSNSESCYFLQLPSSRQQKFKFFLSLFAYYLLFEGTITSLFKDKKS
jgi:hypothetical protein